MNRAYCAHFEDGARQAALELLLKKQLPSTRRRVEGKLLIAVTSWNLHGHPCWESPETLEDLIRGSCDAEIAAPDLFVFCFQEFAELSASNVVLLNSGDERRQSQLELAICQALKAVLREDFVPVRSVGMVGRFGFKAEVRV